MRWHRDELCSSEKQIEELCGINAYYLIDQEMEQAKPGCDWPGRRGSPVRFGPA